MITSDLHRKLEQIDSKLDRIERETRNLSRISTLTNASIIVQEILRAIGKSEVRAALLHFTRAKISNRELASKVGVDPSNLPKYMKPFLEKGYILALDAGKERAYERSELVDLVSFESLPEFQKLFSSWEENVKKPEV